MATATKTKPKAAKGSLGERCGKCGATGLHWARYGRNMRLWGNGKLHVCHGSIAITAAVAKKRAERAKEAAAKGQAPAPKDLQSPTSTWREKPKPKPPAKPAKGGQTGMIMSVPPAPKKAAPAPKVPDEDEELARVSALDEDAEELQTATIPPKRQMFENDYVTQLCTQFKLNEDFQTYQLICAATSDLIDAIIRVHRFHLQAPFEDIKNHLFLQFRQWIRGVKTGPGSPKVYTYFSTCIKNGCLSYISKEKQLHERMLYVNDTPLEAFKGTEYTVNFDYELRQSILQSLQALETRWNEPVINEVIKYLVMEVVGNKAGPRRPQVLRTVTSAYSLSLDTAKFLLDWTHAAIRMCLLERYDQPLGEIDIIRVADKFSMIPDIIDCIGLENAKKLMSVFAGITVRFPSHTQLRKYPVLKRIYETLEADPSPNAVNGLASHLRTSSDKVNDHFRTMHENIQDGLLDNRPLYDRDDQAPDDMLAETFDK